MQALLIVEPDFHQIHPGVRRVIGFHAIQLQASGYNVAFAAPQDGQLVLGVSDGILDAIHPRAATPSTTPVPDWSSRDLHACMSESLDPDPSQEPDLRWNASRLVRDEPWDVVIYTNPWICSEEFVLPNASLSIGIVYDLIPNMLSMAELHFPVFVNVYEFAHLHALGFEFFRRHTDLISCISDSTRTLLAEHYGSAPTPELVTQIPFRDFGNGLRSENASQLLMVNVLDPRKNFSAVRKVVKEAAAERSLEITIVGRERIDRADALKFFEDLSAHASSVQWFRSPSDIQLDRIMDGAGVLLFPSFFEGLGLPILEAQAKGIPAVSSDTSSCIEINMNPSLAVPPEAVNQLKDAMFRALDRDQGIVSGQELRNRQLAFLAPRTPLITERASAQPPVPTPS